MPTEGRVPTFRLWYVGLGVFRPDLDFLHKIKKGRNPGFRPKTSQLVAGVRFELTTFGL